MGRARLRDLGISIGTLPTGPLNAITDVPGVWVGQRTVVHDTPHVARTGVTIVTFREGRVLDDFAFAGYHSFNGCGEMTGVAWLQESGLLSSPIALTNTAQIGLVRDSITKYAVDRLDGRAYWLPVAAETYDGWLNDMAACNLTTQDVYEAMDDAGPGPVEEGNVGGGTGMICHDFKGGIGTSSRLAQTPLGTYTLGALVQANYGERALLRIDGVPVGREIGPDEVPLPWDVPPLGSSIIVVIATDAPLLPTQCRALAGRATVGLARAGGTGHAFSGDLFLAFTTANHVPPRGNALLSLQALPQNLMDGLFDAVAEAVEESIANALVAAESMTGYRGHSAQALPLGRLQEVMAKYRPAAHR